MKSTLFHLPAFIAFFYSSILLGQETAGCPVSFFQKDYQIETDLKNILTIFYSEKDSVDFYLSEGCKKETDYSRLTETDTIRIGYFEFSLSDLLRNYRESKEQVHIFNIHTNNEVKVKEKIKKYTDYTGGMGEFSQTTLTLIDKKTRKKITEEMVIAVGLPD